MSQDLIDAFLILNPEFSEYKAYLSTGESCGRIRVWMGWQHDTVKVATVRDRGQLYLERTLREALAKLPKKK